MDDASEDARWPALRSRRRRLVLVVVMILSGLAVIALSIVGSTSTASLCVILDPVQGLGGASGAAVVPTLAFNAAIVLLTGVFLLIGSLLAMGLIRNRAGQRYARFGAFAAVAAIVACGVQDVLRLIGGAAMIDGAMAFSVLVVSAQVVAWPIALVGGGLTIVRGFRWSRGDPVFISPRDALPPLALTTADAHRDRHFSDGAVAGGGAAGAAVAATLVAGTNWARGFNIPDAPDLIRRLAAGGSVVGVSLSGGGVRAGSLALGVLQAEGMRTALGRADYLVSVSGGGYTAGAFQQALNDVEPAGHDGWEMVRDPGTVLLPGTAEEDYVRRNASYLANTPGRLLDAFARMAAHLLLTLGLVFGPAVAVGVALGWAYGNFSWKRIAFAKPAASLGDELANAMPGGTWWLLALAVPLAVAALFWLIGVFAPRSRRLRFWATCLIGLAVVTALVAAGLPALLGLAAWITHASNGTAQVAATSLWGIVATYAVSLISIARVSGTRLSNPSSWVKKLAVVPGAVLNMLLVAIILLAVVVGWLLLAGGIAVATIIASNPAKAVIPTVPAIVGAALLAYAIVVGGLVDETSLSLHPYYRARLASAFAVRRMRRRAAGAGMPDDGATVAVAYPAAERTSLSRYAARPQAPVPGGAEGVGRPVFPKVVFAASATISAPRTPAGSNRVSYTFSGDWIGGPEIGYVRAQALERLSPHRIRRDLTVQGAVAISGAAISASGGGQGAPWYQTLFALTGVRLGAWLPNPGYVMNRYREGVDREVEARDPRIPRKRRIDYLMKELLGPHSHGGPMLQVTDGGFYDNLGLVELLRRRCTEIYCVDASGDAGNGPTSLSHAISVAAEELGVRIDWGAESVWSASAGAMDASKLSGPLAALGARFGVSPVLTGTVRYPDECGVPGLRGTIRVARASLWPDLPAEVLTYALDHAAFPNDSTADQWFDDEDYRAYTALGRRMGDILAPVVEPDRTMTPEA